jgi:hypothetical protein
VKRDVPMVDRDLILRRRECADGESPRFKATYGIGCYSSFLISLRNAELSNEERISAQFIEEIPPEQHRNNEYH